MGFNSVSQPSGAKLGPGTRTWPAFQGQSPLVFKIRLLCAVMAQPDPGSGPRSSLIGHVSARGTFLAKELC